MTDATPTTPDLTNYPELLLEIVETVRELLVSAGIDQARAHDIGFAAAEKVRGKHGGLNNYIPKGIDFDLTLRDREMWRRYNGANRVALCREYDITEQRFYQIMRRIRAEEVERTQMKLFG